MSKIVYLNPNDGSQVLITVGEGGRCAPTITVLWDETRDGPLSSDLESKLGGLVRQGNSLVVDDVLLASHQTSELARSNAKQAKATAYSQSTSLLDSLDLSKPLSVPELQNAVSALIKLIRNRA